MLLEISPSAAPACRSPRTSRCLSGDASGVTACPTPASTEAPARRTRSGLAQKPDPASWPLLIDGFNLILTLESALGGGVMLVGRDGCYRDMASVHGTYRRVEETR